MTRLRHRQQQESREQTQPSEDDRATPNQVPEPEDGDVHFLSNLHDSLFAPAGPTKPTLTRAQKSEHRRLYRQDIGVAGCRQPGALSGVDVTPEELRKLQDGDESLRQPRHIADGEPSAGAGEQYFRQDGLLYRRYSPPGRDSDELSVDQLVLPKQLRPTVLKLAHDIPMAGHLGKKKTADRVLQRFYWPGVYHDVQDHCRTCSQCQKSSTRRVKKAPLVPLPIMDEPFQRIAMDIVGPLPRSSTGKRYILVICDYATRYPEAIAPRTIDANAAAEELLAFFARVGVPEEILTDQGTNFTSQLLAEVYKLLRIKPTG